MRIQTAIVTRELDLGDYDESLRGQSLAVWVNPPQAVRAERVALIGAFAEAIRKSVSTATDQGKAASPNFFSFWKKPFRGPDGDDALRRVERRTYAWLANILSQGEEPCTVDELERLIAADVALYEFILKRSVEMIEAFRVEKKSPSRMPLTT